MKTVVIIFIVSLLILQEQNLGVFGAICDVLTCTKTYICDIGQIIPNKITEIGKFKTENFISLENVQNTNIKNKDKLYISGSLENEIFEVFATETFENYTLLETTSDFLLKASFQCRSNELPIISTYTFNLKLDQSNQYEPRFSQKQYEFKISLPFAQGYECIFDKKIKATDLDIKYYKIAFSSENPYFDFGVAETEDNGHTSYVSFKVKRAITEIDEQIEIDITAKDNGDPPLFSTAKIILTADKTKSLPPQPRFQKALYKGNLTRSKELEIGTLILEESTYDKSITFDKEGKNSKYFEIIQDENKIQIKIDEIDDEVIEKNTILDMTIIAKNPQLDSPGKTAVVVEIERPLSNDLQFLKPIFDGEINEDNHFQPVEIQFTNEEQNLDNIEFKLNGENSEYFQIKRANNTVFLELKEQNIPLKWLKLKYIAFELSAEEIKESLSAICGILINLPTKLQIPQFSQILYKGKILSKTSVDIPKIPVPETELTPILKFSGHKNFTINQKDNLVEINIAEGHELTDEDLQLDYISLTLEARYEGFEKRTSATTIIVSTPKLGPRPEFNKRHYKGKVNEYLEFTIETINIINEINIKSETLEGDDSDLFTIKKIDDQNLIIELKRDLKEEDIKDRKYFEFIVVVENEDKVSASALVSIDLPFRCDDSPCPPCTTPRPTPPTTTTPEPEKSILKFESDIYQFSAKSSTLGQLGIVKALLNGAISHDITYIFGNIEQDLKSRLQLDSSSGTLSIYATISPGVYIFEMLAKHSEVSKPAQTFAKITVSPIEYCGDENSKVANALLIKNLEEEHPHYGIMDIIEGNCRFEIFSIHPDFQEFFVINSTTNQLDFIAVDREDKSFAGMLVVQIQAKLYLKDISNLGIIDQSTKSFTNADVIIDSTIVDAYTKDFDSSTIATDTGMDIETSTMDIETSTMDIETSTMDIETSTMDIEITTLPFDNRTLDVDSYKINLNNRFMPSYNRQWQHIPMDSLIEDKRSYVLTEDIESSLIQTVLTIIVVDINDNYPIFQHPPQDTEEFVIGYPANEFSNQIFPEYLIKVHANDLDIGLNALIRYKLNSSDFGINETNGIIYPYANALSNSDEILLTVYAIDRDGQAEGSLQNFVKIRVKKIFLNQIAVLDFQGTPISNIDELLQKISKNKGFDLKAIKWAIIPGDIHESRELLSRILRFSFSGRNDHRTKLRVWVYGLTNDKNIVDSETIVSKLSDVSNVKSETYQNHEKIVQGQQEVSGFIVGIVILSVVCFGLIAFILWISYFRKLIYNKLSRNRTDTPTLSDDLEPYTIDKQENSTKPADNYLRRESVKISGITTQETSDYQSRMLEMLKSGETDLSNDDRNVSDASSGYVERNSNENEKLPNGEVGERRKSVVTFNDLVERIEIEGRGDSDSESTISERL